MGCNKRTGLRSVVQGLSNATDASPNMNALRWPPDFPIELESHLGLQVTLQKAEDNLARAQEQVRLVKQAKAEAELGKVQTWRPEARADAEEQAARDAQLPAASTPVVLGWRPGPEMEAAVSSSASAVDPGDGFSAALDQAPVAAARATSPARAQAVDAKAMPVEVQARRVAPGSAAAARMISVAAIVTDAETEASEVEASEAEVQAARLEADEGKADGEADRAEASAIETEQVHEHADKEAAQEMKLPKEANEAKDAKEEEEAREIREAKAVADAIEVAAGRETSHAEAKVVVTTAVAPLNATAPSQSDKAQRAHNPTPPSPPPRKIHSRNASLSASPAVSRVTSVRRQPHSASPPLPTSSAGAGELSTLSAAPRSPSLHTAERTPPVAKPEPGPFDWLPWLSPATTEPARTESGPFDWLQWFSPVREPEPPSATPMQKESESQTYSPPPPPSSEVASGTVPLSPFGFPALIPGSPQMVHSSSGALPTAARATGYHQSLDTLPSARAAEPLPTGTLTSSFSDPHFEPWSDELAGHSELETPRFFPGKLPPTNSWKRQKAEEAPDGGTGSNAFSTGLLPPNQRPSPPPRRRHPDSSPPLPPKEWLSPSEPTTAEAARPRPPSRVGALPHGEAYSTPLTHKKGNPTSDSRRPIPPAQHAPVTPQPAQPSTRTNHVLQSVPLVGDVLDQGVGNVVDFGNAVGDGLGSGVAAVGEGLTNSVAAVGSGLSAVGSGILDIASLPVLGVAALVNSPRMSQGAPEPPSRRRRPSNAPSFSPRGNDNVPSGSNRGSQTSATRSQLSEEGAANSPRTSLDSALLASASNPSLPTVQPNLNARPAASSTPTVHESTATNSIGSSNRRVPSFSPAPAAMAAEAASAGLDDKEFEDHDDNSNKRGPDIFKSLFGWLPITAGSPFGQQESRRRRP